VPVPNWTDGQVLYAADVVNWLAPLAAVKTSDQSVTSSTTLINDTALVVTPAVSATYLLVCYLNFEGAANGGVGNGSLKWQWGVPTGAFLRYQGIFMGTGGAAAVNNTYAATDIPAAGTQGAGNLCGASMTGTLVMGSTSGNLQLKWAQNASNGTATTVHAQSCLYLQRIG
jgi:hypothetical protein